MPKLFLGNREVTPAIYNDGANRYSPSRTVENGVLKVSPNCEYVDLTGVDTIDGYALSYAYYNTQNNTHTIPDFSNIVEVKTNGLYNAFYYNQNATGTINFSSLETAGDNSFYFAFYGCQNITGTVDFSSLKHLKGSNYHFYYTFYNCKKIEEVKFNSLECVGELTYTYGSFQNAFYNCTSLRSADFGSLETVHLAPSAFSQTFYGCTSLTDVDFSSLISVHYTQTTWSISMFTSCFSGCKSLTSIDLGSLSFIESYACLGSMFYDCTNLENVDLSSLNVVFGDYILQQTFRKCTSLTTLSFPKLIKVGLETKTTTFNNMLQDCTDVTVHFPSNLQSIIGSWSDVQAGFGGTNTTILFDLPAYNIIDLTKITKARNDYQYYNLFYDVPLDNTPINISNLKYIEGNYTFGYAFSNCAGSPEIDMSGLETINGNYTFSSTFSNCSGSPTIDMSSLKSINGNYTFSSVFSNCSGSPEIDMSNLEIVNGNYVFQSLFSNVKTNANPNIKLDSLKRINGNSVAYRMYYNAKEQTDIDLQNLTTIGGYQASQEMFRNCPKLESVDLRRLSVLGTDDESTSSHGTSLYYAFADCPNLTTVNLDSLENVSYWYFKRNTYGNAISYMFYNSGIAYNPLINASSGKNFSYVFYNCKNLTDGTFKKLTYISDQNNNALSNCFNGCTSMTRCDFPSLMKTRYAQTFYDTFYNCTNTNFTDVSFPMWINFGGYNPFSNPYSFRTGGSNRLTVHFRKDMQSIVSALSGYSNGWGAGAIVFDLIGTITVDGNNYLRIGYCNKPGYVAWIKSTSNIVVNGTTYIYNQNEITDLTQRSTINPDVLHGVLFGWEDSTNNTIIRSHKIELENGDFVYSANNVGDPDLEITTANVEIVYTSDSAEPDVGDSVYSDLGTTVIGTISAVA